MGVAWQKLIVSVNLAQISGAQDRTNCREKEKKEMISVISVIEAWTHGEVFHKQDWSGHLFF